LLLTEKSIGAMSPFSMSATGAPSIKDFDIRMEEKPVVPSGPAALNIRSRCAES